MNQIEIMARIINPIPPTSQAVLLILNPIVSSYATGDSKTAITYQFQMLIIHSS